MYKRSRFQYIKRRYIPGNLKFQVNRHGRIKSYKKPPLANEILLII